MQSVIARRFLYDPISELRSELGWPAETNWRPAEDIVETSDKTIIKLDIPGLSSKDLNIQFQDGMLQVSGQRENMTETTEGTVQRLERTSGSFSRYYRLAEGVEPEQVQASLQDGVLELQVPKPEKVQAVQIPIQEAPQLEAGEVSQTSE